MFRRHGALYTPWVLLGIGIVGSGVWYWRWFYERPPWGLFVLLFFVVAGGLLAVRFFLQWHASTVTVATDRLVVVDQRGLFERHVSEVAFDHIQDIGYHIRGFSQVVVGYGTVEIRSSASREVLRFQQLPRPALVRSRLVEHWQQYRAAHPQNTSPQTLEEAQKLVGELEKKFGKEAVRALLDE